MPEKKVVLEVRADNDRAIGLYEWHGFVKTVIHMERR
jgi:ribosomal protein S18 acetylase RimI-like enzyme